MSTAVQMTAISKSFKETQALKDVSLKVEQGTIHAVVGENGAGKTTLMKVLFGSIQPDSGEIQLFHEKMKVHSQAEAINSGIGMVSQHYNIIPDLTCIQNLILGSEPDWRLHSSRVRQKATQLARSMKFEFDWDQAASTLGPAGMQKLEILKLLWRNSRIMILDEPTAMLSPSDSDALFASLKQLTSEGATILLVTHRIPEVMRFCDKVTVLRSGHRVAESAVKDTSPQKLSEEIIGHGLPQQPQLGPQIHADVSVNVDALTATGSKGQIVLKHLSFSIRRGEIIGIAGVDGNGQKELFQTLLGTNKPGSGSVDFFGDCDFLNKSTSQRIASGVRFIPEDRQIEGLIDDWSVSDNAILGLHRIAFDMPKTANRTSKLSDLAIKIADRFGTKRQSMSSRVGDLSGGNQQRLVLGRALARNPKLILGFQPTRGLDIDATQAVYSAFRSEATNGASVLIVSFDLDELLVYCDRILVMRDGKLFEPPIGHERDRLTLGQLMVGTA